MLARTDSRARAVVLLLIAAIAAGAIGARLVWWQVISRDGLARMAAEQFQQQQGIPAERGEIADRNGTLLATSVELQSIFATPPSIPDPAAAASMLAPILDMPRSDLQARLEANQAWIWLERRVDPTVAERIRSLHLRGIGMLPETKRVYPIAGVADDTTIAAQLIGFVNADGTGQYGVEDVADGRLAGVPGSVTADQDVVGRRIADSVRVVSEPVDGADMRLTIDAGVQHLLEAEMWSSFRKNHAVGVTGLIMDARTGAIVAMATYPSYDANAFGQTDVARFTSPAVARQHEPGSVIKPFTIAAALDAGAITTSETFDDDNNLRIGSIRIQNADRYDHPNGHGPITAADVLKLSNNVGAAKIGLALGRDGLYEALRRFGFGSPTGIELSGEASGVVWNPNGPNASGDLTAAQNAFGQGLSVTSVQLAAGYAAFANGGNLVNPHVIAGWADAGGSFEPEEHPPAERIMRAETAETVLGMLVASVDDGIAAGAAIGGYTVAGKTGTAQIAGPMEVTLPSGERVERWEYISGWIDSSFIGILPRTGSPLVTVITLHRPATWGRYRMAERPETVYARMMPQVLDYLAVPPDRPVAPVAQP